ncbi:MAG: helicase [Nitrospira sp.]|nr:MAG: helicase [Nitrospira sp.]
MKIPYVIDNQTNRLTDVLNGLLAEHAGRSVDVATAYFTVQGYRLLKDGLDRLGTFRLLLGAEPHAGEDVGLHANAKAVKAALTGDLNREPFTEETLRLIEDLIRYLRKDHVLVNLHDQGFLHAKCFLFYADRPGQQGLFDRFRPIVAIVGSSNFTGPGLTSNRELNLAHKVLLDDAEVEDPQAEKSVAWLSDQSASERISLKNRQLIKSEVGARAIIELEQWYERQWQDARNFKDDLIALLDASKFGQFEYTPYQIYMKALFEYFKDDLDRPAEGVGRSAVDLAEFQEDAVRKARKILARYDGVMVADSVGLGKTWIGKKLLEDFAYHLRQQALVVCPASLEDMWETELGKASISVRVISQERLGQADFAVDEYSNVDVILIDESHNFRNPGSQRYENLERLIGLNGGLGRDGNRKKLILLTATPVNNDLLDLYQQINLFTRGDLGYFAAAGIGDLRKYFLAARREVGDRSSAVALFNLLEEVVIRRTRPFIRQAYPDATINGERITFPERKLKTVRYDLEATYNGIYAEVVFGIEGLRLAPYNLEAFKKKGVEVDELEAGREQALVGIFKSRYLKRFESSIAAFRISVRRALEFQKTFESYILDGKALKSVDFHRAMRFLEREGEEDDALPTSKADELDASEDAKTALGTMPIVDPAQYNLRALHAAVQHDIDTLTKIWQRVKDIKPEKDAKLQKLKTILFKDLKGKKVIIFTYYKDTARYLYEQLGGDAGAAFLKKAGNPHVRRMDSGAAPKERVGLVQAFAPVANKRPELLGTEKEVDLLISTDVLSEGQNLQDCGYLVNYDLHWNPTRMVQRAGRIDRIGTKFDTLWIYNMFPEEGLERLLRLVQSLSAKIADIDRTGFLDASVLGETVHPRNFNTLRRIREEDGTVIEEEEQFTELASNEFLLQQLRTLLNKEGQEALDQLPDGIHSGLARDRTKGIFFYFKAGDPIGQGHLHFWRYYDLRENRIVDNRYLIANLIACNPDTPRVVADYDVFDLKEKIVIDILQSHQRQQSIQAAPKVIDPIQATVATAIQGYLQHPKVDRVQALDAIRYLNQPLPGVQVKELRNAFKAFRNDQAIDVLLQVVLSLKSRYGTIGTSDSGATARSLRREDLHLVCFEYICS